MKTYQDFLEAKDKGAFVLDAINEHRTSEAYKIAVDAEEYDRQRNVTIMQYQRLLYTLEGRAVPDNFSANYKLCSNFFNRFVTQENQYLLGNGVILEQDSNKARLGANFDQRLQEAGRNALVQGVGFGFWNFDHLEAFKLTEFVPLYDEENGALMAGIRFWQIAPNKPLRATLYELDGFTEYLKKKTEDIQIKAPKRAYRQIEETSEMDGSQIYDLGNYPGFPIVPLWGNTHRQSELVGMREAIDCYDLIKSGFANDLDDASMIYWTLQNAGGMDDVSLKQFVERLKTVKAAAVDDGVTAEAHTMEVPYQSRVAYLERLEHDLYRDAQILDIDSLSAASKTATEINAAYQPMDNKVDQYEYCVLDFLQGIFKIAGIEDNPTFKRSKITNQLEQTQMVLMAAQYLDDETILNKMPWLTPEEVQDALDRRDQTEQQRLIEEPAGPPMQTEEGAEDGETGA